MKRNILHKVKTSDIAQYLRTLPRPPFNDTQLTSDIVAGPLRKPNFKTKTIILNDIQFVAKYQRIRGGSLTVKQY